MKVRKEDYRTILSLMEKKRWEGYEFVAFPDGDLPLEKEELYTFQELFEAQEFCYEMSTDVDRYDFLAVRAVYRAMAEYLTNKSFLPENNGIVDVSRMVTLYYQRLEKEQLTQIKNLKIMENTENTLESQIEKAAERLKYLGVDQDFIEQFKAKAAIEMGEYAMKYIPKFDNTSVDFHFRNTEEKNGVYLNKFDIDLIRNNVALTQTFYIGGGGPNFTMTEAYNLMNGRAVYKEGINKVEKVEVDGSTRYEATGEKYNAWLKLNFNEIDDRGNFKMQYFHDAYGYDLVGEVHKLQAILGTAEEAQLIKSLQKGNISKFTTIVEKVPQQRYAEANPQFKTLSIYDENMKRVNNRQTQAKKQAENEGQEVAQTETSQRQSNSASKDDTDTARAEKKSKAKSLKA